MTDGAHAVNIKDCWFFLQTGTLRYTPISNFHGSAFQAKFMIQRCGLPHHENDFFLIVFNWC